MASGKPVISTRCDGAPEQFEHERHGLLVPMEDVAALGEATAMSYGDAAKVEEAFAGAAHTVSLDLVSQRLVPSAMTRP